MSVLLFCIPSRLLPDSCASRRFCTPTRTRRISSSMPSNRVMSRLRAAACCVETVSTAASRFSMASIRLFCASSGAFAFLMYLWMMSSTLSIVMAAAHRLPRTPSTHSKASFSLMRPPGDGSGPSLQ